MELYHYFFEIILISVLDTIKQEAMVRISCYNVLEQKWQSAHFIILGPNILMNFLLVLEIQNRMRLLKL